MNSEELLNELSRLQNHYRIPNYSFWRSDEPSSIIIKTNGDFEYVSDEELPKVANLFWNYGWCGILYWASKKNNGMKSEFFDNNRFIEFVENEEKIMKRQGLKQHELETEFRKRVQLIYNLYKRRIFEFSKVQEIINRYYKKPEEVLRQFGVQ